MYTHNQEKSDHGTKGSVLDCVPNNPGGAVILMRENSFTIGMVAKLLGINVETIRYYQRIGLVAEPQKAGNRVRHYGEEIVNRLFFVRRAKNLGFTVSEIGDMLRYGHNGCNKVRNLVAGKLNEVCEEITRLQEVRSKLAELVESCDGVPADGGCPTMTKLQAEVTIAP